MILTLGCIVEGDGEIQAVPVLIRRFASSIDATLDVRPEIRRVPKSKLLNGTQFERTLEALGRQIGRRSPIIVLLDADKDCPAELAEALLRRAKAEHRDLRVSVVVAQCEYEAWFIAAAASLCRHGGLREDLVAPLQPDTIRDAKGWLSERMQAGGIYVATRHQAAFTASFDLESARLSRSFRKCEKEVLRLLSEKPDPAAALH